MNKHGIFQQTIDTHDAAWWHVPSLLRCIGLCIGLLSPMVTLADGDFAQLSPTFYSFPATAIGNSSTDPALTFTNTGRAAEHTSDLQSLMRISYPFFCLKTKKYIINLSVANLPQDTYQNDTN